MNMALTQPVLIRVTRTCSWRGLMSIIMKLLVASMCQELFWWIWSQELWTLCVLDLLDKSFVPTILCLVGVVLPLFANKLVALF